MEIEISKEVVNIRLKEGRDFIDIELSSDGEINDVTSNFPYESALMHIFELNDKDYDIFISLINEGRNQLKKVKNNEI